MTGALLPFPAPLSFRAVWISDAHLGSPACRARELASFLRCTHSEYLYLVGDAFDLWCAGRRWTWGPAQAAAVHRVAAMARQGTRVFYLPGNHDRVAADFAGQTLAGARVQAEAVHETAQGCRLAVFHGDHLEREVKRRPRLEAIGNAAYSAVQTADRCLRRANRRLGRSQWSIASFLKRNLPPAASYIRRFEEAGRREASRRRVDGVVCGHIHHPALQWRADGWYANAGDWVDNCTALVERLDGSLALVHCGAVPEAASAPQPFRAAAAAQGLGAEAGLTGT